MPTSADRSTPRPTPYTAQNNFNNSYSVSGSLPLFNGFKVVNNLRIAKIARLQGAENMQLINDEIALETMQAYADVHYYRGMVNLAGEQLAESKNTLYQAKVQEELGLKATPTYWRSRLKWPARISISPGSKTFTPMQC